MERSIFLLLCQKFCSQRQLIIVLYTVQWITGTDLSLIAVQHKMMNDSWFLWIRRLNDFLLIGYRSSGPVSVGIFLLYSQKITFVILKDSDLTVQFSAADIISILYLYGSAQSHLTDVRTFHTVPFQRCTCHVPGFCCGWQIRIIGCCLYGYGSSLCPVGSNIRGLQFHIRKLIYLRIHPKGTQISGSGRTSHIKYYIFSRICNGKLFKIMVISAGAVHIHTHRIQYRIIQCRIGGRSICLRITTCDGSLCSSLCIVYISFQQIGTSSWQHRGLWQTDRKSACPEICCLYGITFSVSPVHFPGHDRCIQSFRDRQLIRNTIFTVQIITGGIRFCNQIDHNRFSCIRFIQEESFFIGSVRLCSGFHQFSQFSGLSRLIPVIRLNIGLISFASILRR